jgi:uncharacterized membrane-anchored protein YitT (DUF2179 family)
MSTYHFTITPKFIRGEIKQLPLLILGTLISAFGFAVFLAPNNLSAGGLTGISLIINNFTGWPVGTLFLILNLPLIILGFRELGRWPFVWRTLIASFLFSLFTDLFIWLMPQLLNPFPPTDDILLSAIYGGLLGGVGAGIVFRTGSTMGGTTIIGRLIQRRTGLPLSQSFIYTDGLILLVMGFVFGWQTTLYGLLILIINGLTADFMLEGASITRVANIVTNHPREISDALIQGFGRGVSYWPITGGFTGQTRYMVTCTIYRSQMRDVQEIVAGVDPQAFVTISVGQRAFGQGFVPLEKKDRLI